MKLVRYPKRQSIMQRVLLAVLSTASVVTGVDHEPFAMMNTQRALRQPRTGSGFVRTLEFKHRLRVCNAYPYAGAVDVYRGVQEKLTQESMPYKSCRDFQTPLKAGDKLNFKVGDANAGTFVISDLPNNDAILLLVINRHDTLSTAVSFESHVFANLLNAQVAVIDTYKGTARAGFTIEEAGRTEKLRFNSIVAVNPGEYHVVLTSPDGGRSSKSNLVALNRESYVVLRTGVEAQQGPSYPEEIVVFPKHESSSLFGAFGGAFGALVPAKLMLALVVLMVARQ